MFEFEAHNNSVHQSCESAKVFWRLTAPIDMLNICTLKSYTRMITENKEECQMFVTDRTLRPTYPEQILLETFKQRSAVLCNSTSRSSWSHVTRLPQQSADWLMRIALLPPWNNNLLFPPKVLLSIHSLTSQLKSNFSLRGVRRNKLEDLLFLSYLGVCWLPLTFRPSSVLTFSLVEAAPFPVSLLWERESWRRSRSVCVFGR